MTENENVMDIAAVANLKAAFDSYATAAQQTNVSPPEYGVLYSTIGLCGEAGEFAEKIKKLLRDKKGAITQEDRVALAGELGDVLWYIQDCAKNLNIPFHIIPILNINKLQSRQARGVLHGNGDNR